MLKNSPPLSIKPNITTLVINYLNLSKVLMIKTNLRQQKNVHLFYKDKLKGKFLIKCKRRIAFQFHKKQIKFLINNKLGS